MRNNPHRSTGETSLSRGYPPPGTLHRVSKDEVEALKAHVERLIVAAGHNPTSIAVAAGLNPHYVRQWLSGRVRNPGTRRLQRIADIVGVTIDELTTPSDAVPPRTPLHTRAVLPVRYIVQAGAWHEVDDMAQERLKSPPVGADPSYPPEWQWLELVRGDSMDMFYPEGSWVHVVDAVALGYAPRHEDFVTVERRRQQGGLIERSLKQIAKKGRKVELWPRSRNPKWSAALELGDTRDDDTVVEIAALVIGGYLPARR